MSERLRLVAGLGNPGEVYAGTRHNIGFMVADALAEQYGITLSVQAYGAVFGRGRINGAETIIARPMNYMNRSGPPVHRICEEFGIIVHDVIVIHDDIDLEFGRLKIKEKGGHVGHRGVASLMDVFGGGDFVRLRMGIGRPGTGVSVIDHVLGRFSPEEVETLKRLIVTGRNSVVTVLCEGTKEGMNVFNRKR